MKNGTMMQYFEWELKDDGKHWVRLKEDAQHLSDIGITAVWIPPCFKGTESDDVGYGIYDLYDLGEFDQNGTVRTKYGTKEELLEAIDALHEHGIQVYADVVLNHKAAADGKEKFHAVKVAEDDRNNELSEPYEIEGWTHFNFPGRNGKYSDFEWHWYHFNGVDYDARTGEEGIFRIEGDHKQWAEDEAVSTEFGNYDYLMFADVDFSHPEVREEVKRWASWFINETKIDGMRLDAVKHIHKDFINEFIDHVRGEFGDDFFIVAEYWDQEYGELNEYMQDQDYALTLMDVGFHYALSEASKAGADYDLTQLFDDTLYKKKAANAVTFVDNHDSQPGQSLESFVEPWFKPQAYGIILLSKNGYPCVFYGDYYGIGGENPIEGIPDVLDKLLHVRTTYAYGEQQNYLDHPNCIGFTRTGDENHPHGCAVVLSNSEEGHKKMTLGELNAGTTYIDCLHNRDEEITLDEEGTASFPVNAGSISVWVPKEQ
ncbi:alpha-amylase [Atopococcus tabaci]|uniref:alpha-amylase n=1 Tax=Atopococcus tabaci TaxID=269774 RepID=UPI0004825C2C|nr:alpha-amylase [Atopococcus tabaci]